MVRSVQPQRAGNLLVGVAANDKFEDFPLAWRQSPETGAHDVHFVLLDRVVFGGVRKPFQSRERGLSDDYWLGQEVIRTRLDGLHGGGNVGIASEEYDRQR